MSMNARARFAVPSSTCLYYVKLGNSTSSPPPKCGVGVPQCLLKFRSDNGSWVKWVTTCADKSQTVRYFAFAVDICPRTYPPGHFPRLDNFPPHLEHSTRLLNRAKIWKLALTRIPDPNRSTAINFVDVNGRSLYIVCRLADGGSGRGKCPTPRRNGGELSERGKCREEHVQVPDPGFHVSRMRACDPLT